MNLKIDKEELKPADPNSGLVFTVDNDKKTSALDKAVMPVKS